MKKLVVFLAVVLAVSAFAITTQALALSFSLDTAFPGWDKPNPAGTGPWLTAVFANGSNPGDVLVTLSSSLSGTNFVTEWDFNLNPLFDPTQLTFAVQNPPAPTAPDAPTKSGAANAYKADGDGYFDITFVFPKSNGSRFDDSESITYLIHSDQQVSGLYITPDSFNFKSVQSGGESIWFTAAHIQGLTNTGIFDPDTGKEIDSTWIGDDESDNGGGGGGQVPEPATLLLLGSGLFGVGLKAKKKLRR